ncbi:MAG: MDR family MFS transporter [Candidatus Peregrinibacteria bacterium]
MTTSIASKPAVPRWLILLTVIMGTFLGRLDQTIVNLALPHIIDDFRITVSSAGWIATAYILANAVFVPVWGKLGDTIGRKKVYLLGFGIFIVGSILAGLAWNLQSMILFRVIQAIAGSADYPTAMAIIAVTYENERERAQALGIWSASFAAAAVFGPLLGGPLIDYFSWRAVFLINLPIGAIGILMAIAFVPESTSGKRAASFDIKGSIVLGIALSALVLVLDKGLDWGWTSWQSLLTYLITIVATVTFIRIEQGHKEPIVDLKFFKNSIFVYAIINNFVVFMGLMGSIFLVPIFAQTFLGYNATETGFLFMPMAAALMIGAPIGGHFTGRVQSRLIIAASTLIAAIGLWMFLSLDPRSGPLDIVLPIIVLAFGLGFGMAERTNIIASTVPTHEVGIASSVLALARNIAGAFGIAVFSTILQNTTEWNVLNIAKRSVFSGTLPAQYQQFVALITLKAQINAYHTVYFTAAMVVLIGAVLAMFIPKVKLSRDIKVHVEG